MFTPSPDTTRHTALIEQAKAEASRLRREAIEQFGNDALRGFWRGANAVWGRSVQVGHGLAQRSSARVAARLQRHRAARARDTAKLEVGA